MADSSPVQNIQKIACIYSSARERDIAVRIYYDMQIRNNCTVYHLGQVEEID